MKKKDDNLYEESVPFFSVYKEYESLRLPNWVKMNLDTARVYGHRNKGIILEDGRKYNIDNKLNDLSGSEWTSCINSVFMTRYPTKGKESYCHSIRKIHPTPKPPQLMKRIIEFFTKENEIVVDTFMGVGGTLLGAALSNRRALGIELNNDYIEAYKQVSTELALPIFPTVCGDCISIFRTNNEYINNAINNEQVSLLLIDPPYSNMMNKEKTGGDISKYGKNSTPFTMNPLDLGNMERDEFLNKLKESIEVVLPFLKMHGHIVVFIKDLQPKGKELNMLHSEVIHKINEIDSVFYKGMRIWVDETAKYFPYGYPFTFVANQIHQYILVFRKEK